MNAEAQQTASEFDIDLRQLQVEWRGQAQKVYNASAHAAKCEKDYADAKSAFGRKAAQLRNDIRTHPDQYGLREKPTETSVEDAAICDPEYRVAEQKMIDAKYGMSLAHAASDALENRKKALEKIVDLWMREYFSEPLPRGKASDGDELNREDARQRMLANSRLESGS